MKLAAFEDAATVGLAATLIDCGTIEVANLVPRTEPPTERLEGGIYSPNASVRDLLKTATAFTVDDMTAAILFHASPECAALKPRPAP